ncbi:Fungal specific transcription factor domain-containing protein [Colletotrichum higginsianum IMI 349063]|uniref:Fungal specific transcription factor domain-containing protein n=2 Tax=Colletotrichum higginsianum TaxID=80884 RepID=A0A1B7XUJ7_COLHI|nr:Fungal specific transcription factor domain-containing protein [Colletotrichum higginsianum IMI 349063]OBR03418.1 Fungal specific transcription factor domain-containing protein [Colletotrichum higginsianum IMI 349063]TIC89967.1 putative transcriptional regulatory protein [Colletotrichum higginsianum]
MSPVTADQPTPRPYRSHLRPACLQCRRRKSRCQQQEGITSSTCQMCHVYGTDCEFPPSPRSAGRVPAPPPLNPGKVQKPYRTTNHHHHHRRPPQSNTPCRREPLASAAKVYASQSATGAAAAAAIRHSTSSPTGTASSGGSAPGSGPQAMLDPHNTHLMLALDSPEDEDNSHIIGPAVTNDTQVLADYLSSEPAIHDRMIRVVKPRPGAQPNQVSRSTVSGGVRKPVIFTAVRKRPYGLSPRQTAPLQKYQIVEKMLEPWTSTLIDLYFQKVNICFPLLDEVSFKHQFTTARDRISPALLSVLYAHSMIFWKNSPDLPSEYCPDSRFIWNQATETLFSELHISPGISTIIAIILNVGGRPTTSMIMNEIQLGAAVSLAQSLGLNRDPTDWNISVPEKCLRMKIWWALVVHDKWLSLAYGTPPQIKRYQYDVPDPSLEYLTTQDATDAQRQAASVFMALVTLTGVLDKFLDHVYDLNQERDQQTSGRTSLDLELSLGQWEDSLGDDVRRIVTRGNDLRAPGAANLRLAYLSTKLLRRRIELDIEKQDDNSTTGATAAAQAAAAVPGDALTNRYIQVRRAAEEIVLLVQELEEDHLGDFWLPVSAFAFTSATTFLLRCALETENTAGGLAQSASLKLAKDLVDALQAHQRDAGWDLGDLCLAQYAEVVERLLAAESPSATVPEFQQLMMSSEVPIIDELFPNLWDMF